MLCLIYMKSKLVGILFIIVGSLMLGVFILSMLMFFGDSVKSALYSGLLSLFIAIYALILGSAIRARKQWSWYAGLITLTLALTGNLITLAINFSTFLLIPITLGLISIYAIYSDKEQFLLNQHVTQSNNLITEQEISTNNVNTDATSNTQRDAE